MFNILFSISPFVSCQFTESDFIYFLLMFLQHSNVHHSFTVRLALTAALGFSCRYTSYFIRPFLAANLMSTHSSFMSVIAKVQRYSENTF